MANTFDVKTYSPKDVVLIIGGYQVTGWQSISITRSVKGFTPIRGIRDKNTRVVNRDTSATLTFPILQSSQSNDVLSYIHELDLEEGTARISLTLKDNSGRSVFNSNEAFITGYPSVTFSGQFEYRNWEIFCLATDTFKVYGNSRPSTSLFDGALKEATNFVEGLF